MATKACTHCGIPKTVETDFYKDNRQLDGKQSWCKACSCAWNHQNHEKRRIVDKRAYDKHREKKRAYARKHRAENPEFFREQYRKRYAANKTIFREWNRKYALARSFGLTPEDYDRILASQNGVCAICGGNRAKRKMRLHVDHCHTSGLIRGLLCGNCNMGLGYFADSVEFLLAAVEYIRRVAATKKMA